MEIERKFLVNKIPDNLTSYPVHEIIQGYLNIKPVVRVRKDNDNYYLTYKGGGKMAREEYNLPLGKEGFDNLIAKCDGNIIHKFRYVIPSQTEGLYVELDIFKGAFEGLVIAEVEFETMEQAKAYTKEDYFGEDVTMDGRYHNSYLSQRNVL